MPPIVKKAAPATPAVDTNEATTLVNIADFQRTRDSVIVALATLQSSVQDLSRAYINHANTVLGPGAGGALDSNLTNILTSSGLLSGGRPTAPDLVLPAEESAADGKKKRKRAKHDPNAPKRALTPYFLFMQTARAQIAKELGDSAKPKEVADEGTRRWSTMAPEDKHVWEEAYQKNLAAYRIRMAAYKAGQTVPSLEEALDMVDQGKVPTQAQIEAMGIVAEVDEDEDEDEPEPVKAPEPPKPAKRRKSEKTAAPVEEPKPILPSPSKAKKSKKEAAAPPPAPVAATPKSTEKKTKKSKKAA